MKDLCDVIRALEFHRTPVCKDENGQCPYYLTRGCAQAMMDDAIALLKGSADDAVYPVRAMHRVYGTNHRCGACGKYIFPVAKYCNECGRRIVWDD